MEYIKQVQGFIRHMDAQAIKMLDNLDNNYDEKYDIVVTLNGKELRVPMNADSFVRMQTFMLSEIAEINELRNNLLRLKRLANLQNRIFAQTSKIPDYFITFEYMGTGIFDPFTNLSGDHDVNPLKYYGKDFLMSDWMNETRLTELEEKLCQSTEYGHQMQV